MVTKKSHLAYCKSYGCMVTCFFPDWCDDSFEYTPGPPIMRIHLVQNSTSESEKNYVLSKNSHSANFALSE